MFDFALIVVLGVFLLSGSAWLISRCLPRRPTARHLVLSTALACCLLVPFLASAFTATGWTLVSLPLLPTSPLTDASQVKRTPVGSVPGAWPETRPLRAIRIDEEANRRASGPASTTDLDILKPITTTPGSGVDRSRRLEYRRVANSLAYRSIAATAIFVLGPRQRIFAR